jgi:hypothetical protein
VREYTRRERGASGTGRRGRAGEARRGKSAAPPPRWPTGKPQGLVSHEERAQRSANGRRPANKPRDQETARRIARQPRRTNRRE